MVADEGLNLASSRDEVGTDRRAVRC